MSSHCWILLIVLQIFSTVFEIQKPICYSHLLCVFKCFF